MIYNDTTTKPTHKLNIKVMGILKIDMYIVIQFFRVFTLDEVLILACSTLGPVYTMDHEVGPGLYKAYD